MRRLKKRTGLAEAEGQGEGGEGDTEEMLREVNQRQQDLQLSGY